MGFEYHTEISFGGFGLFVITLLTKGTSLCILDAGIALIHGHGNVLGFHLFIIKMIGFDDVIRDCTVEEMNLVFLFFITLCLGFPAQMGNT